MKASIVDLRYKMKNVLKALNRGEKVEILYHGKVKGTIHPERQKTDKKVHSHPFSGMYQDEERPVSKGLGSEGKS